MAHFIVVWLWFLVDCGFLFTVWRLRKPHS